LDITSSKWQGKNKVERERERERERDVGIVGKLGGMWWARIQGGNMAWVIRQSKAI
jgi:hypothetical protein